MNTFKHLEEPISNQTNVALQITKQLVESEFNGKNMIFSPLSIHIVLSLIAAGNNSPQLLSFLKSKSIKDLNSLACDLVTSVLVDAPTRGGPRLNFTNGLWVDESKPLEESYKQVALDFYKAALNQVDFKTNPEKVRIQVNSWVEKETKGLIPQILPPGSVSTGTSLIFANALYFKATWDEMYFNESQTKKHEFHLLNGDSVKGVPFMTSKYWHSIGTYDGFKVLRLYFRNYDHDDILKDRCRKYEPRQFSMLWLLPDARDGLPALAERVCSEAGFLDRHARCRKVRVGDFLIPKFKLCSRFGAAGVLRKLGLDDGGIEIVHESVIEVDEKGTTAAAATCGHLMCSAGKPRAPEEKVDFVADHPFMFLIMENMTGAVLFMGQVLNPLAG